MNIKSILYLIIFLPFMAFSQEQTGYYINWDINHAETSVRPSIPISKEEANTINCYLVEFDNKNRLMKVKYYFSGKPSNYSNFGAFELVREYHSGYFTEKYKNTVGEFVENSSKAHEIKYDLNSDGYWIKKENSNNNGELLPEGIAFSRVTRNENNEIATEIQFSAKGDTIPDGNGFKIVHFLYNKDGLTLHRQNKNGKGI